MRDSLLILFSLCPTVLSASTVEFAGVGPVQEFHGSDHPSTAPTDEWWKSFGIDELNELVEEALSRNHDLRSTWLQVEEARAGSMQSFAALLPSSSLDVGANMAPRSSLGFQFGDLGSANGTTDASSTFYTGNALLGVDVPLDIWGVARKEYRASRFDVLATRGDVEAQTMALSALVAEAYFDVLASREELSIVEQQISTSESLLELVEDRYRSGDADGIDVLQQRQQAASTRTTLPSANLQCTLFQRELALLLGRDSTTPVPRLASELPDLPSRPSLAEPTDLVRNRPDVKAMEARLQAAHQRTMSEVLSLLPSLQVSADIGLQGRRIDDLDIQHTWGANASLSLPIFQGGATRASIRQARAQERAAEHDYMQVLLQAAKEVQDAVETEEAKKLELDAYREQYQAARLAFEEARAGYLLGTIEYLTVFTSLESEQQARLNLLLARRQLLSARVQLHEALGGSWMNVWENPPAMELP